MAINFMHIGVPITNKKEGMMYNEQFKVWISNYLESPFNIEYIKYEEGTPFPEILHKNPHVAFTVDKIEDYISEDDTIFFGPVSAGETARVAFILKDDTFIELYEDKA